MFVIYNVMKSWFHYNSRYLTVFFSLFILATTSCIRNTKRETTTGYAESNYVCGSATYQQMALLWYQHSPEARVLYHQAFNMARIALDEQLKKRNPSGKPVAVITDIDETILNNSLYQGWLLTSNRSFSDSTWTAWVADTLAAPLPGAREFLNYAANRGCEVFYLSNRKHVPHFQPTLVNLKKHGLPYADEVHLLLKTPADTTSEGMSTKDIRRDRIMENYDVLLLLGDQLGDFDGIFESSQVASMGAVYDSVEKYRNDFGTRFIMLPNPVYGDWLQQIEGLNRRGMPQVLDSLRRQSVSAWKP